MAQWWKRDALFFVFAAVAYETVFAVPYYAIRRVTQRSLVALLAGFLMLGLVFLARNRITAICDHANQLIEKPSPISLRRLVLSCLATGVVARAAWAFLFSPPLYSDGSRYFKLACNLVNRHSFSEHLINARSFRLAFYPPGYPFYLAPFVVIFGPHEWITTVAAVVCFVVTFLLALDLANRWVGHAAVVVAFLLAIWPEDVMVAGIACKELVLAMLLTAALYYYITCQPGNSSIVWSRVVFSGILTGAAALVQPSLLLFPLVFLAAELISDSLSIVRMLKVTVVALAMLMVIVPWTVRNFFVLHHFVVVSTNGGDVFYRANNSQAHAGYSMQGEIPTPSDELQADHDGYREGLKWIRTNPKKAAVLMFQKQMWYLGNDSDALYPTLRAEWELRAQGHVAWHAIMKLVSNAFWWFLWSIIMVLLPRLRRAFKIHVELAYCFLPIIYQLCIETISESGPRHHIPFSAITVLLVAVAFSQSAPVACESNNATANTWSLPRVQSDAGWE